MTVFLSKDPPRMKTNPRLIEGAAVALLGVAGGALLGAIAVGLIPTWIPIAAAAFLVVAIVREAWH